MIEFAIVLPILILMFAGAVEVGRMLYSYTTLQKSTIVGARYLSTALANADGTFQSSDRTTATNLVVCGSVTCSGASQVQVSITDPGTSVGPRYVTVGATYTYHPLIFDLGAMTGSQQLSLNFTFTPKIKMRYMS
jgi:Flp pilus assembly protein TadG